MVKRVGVYATSVCRHLCACDVKRLEGYLGKVRVRVRVRVRVEG